MLPSGGWMVHLEHVGYGGGPWEQRLQGARVEAASEGLCSLTQGPPIHHEEYVTPTLEYQLAAFRAAGFDAQEVYRQLNTVLLMGRKP